MALIFTSIKAQSGVRMTGFVGFVELVACYINELLLGAGMNGFNKFLV